MDCGYTTFVKGQASNKESRQGEAGLLFFWLTKNSKENNHSRILVVNSYFSDEMRGTDEERTETYVHTVREHRRRISKAPYGANDLKFAGISNEADR